MLRSRQPSTAWLGYGGVPLFPNTPEGQAERLAYSESRNLNHLPDSLLLGATACTGPTATA